MASTSKFHSFNLKHFVYKTVDGHPIETTVCVPKSAAPGKLPLMVHLHGGCLIEGDKIFEDWFAVWLVQLAEAKNAIIVHPNYRLLPEATGKDIIDDLTSFYDWVKTSLPTEVPAMSRGVEVDLTKVLVFGESAGGYLAAQSALRFPEMGFKAVISQYGMLDIAHPHFSKAYSKPIAGAPDFPESTVDDYLKSIQPGAIRSSTLPGPMFPFVATVIRQGRYLEILGEDRTLNPVELLDDAKGLPPLWAIHGREDEIVPIDISEAFVNKMKKTHPQTPVLYTVESGVHGFDTNNVMTDAWVKEGCEFVGKYWP